ncbi:MAG TPA: DegT/DnrJ/EryC1/StrS family aminotransferase [Casimicrobiaceae bacterium]|nr:DegT/DnrJ/EryC1/StrS family aminotransferase [Casimicrobiaceae bacterium]
MNRPIAMADPAAEYRSLREELDAAVQRVLASGRLILGPEGEALEGEIAAYVGAQHAVAVNSGTDALHLALRAAGIGPGDDVLVPAFTFFASAEAVSHAGATPVFVDVDEKTFNADASHFERSVTRRTRAVIAVHLFGQSAPVEDIAQWCRHRDLALIEDCAQAIGADWQGQRVGSFGRFACFSFYPTKNLAAAGDGGLVTCGDAEDAKSLRMLRHHGSKTPYVHEVIGWNSRLDEVQSAMLRVKLGSLARLNEKRRRTARAYGEALAGVPITVPHEHGHGAHVYHQYTIRTRSRERVREALAREGIASAVFYATPLHRQPPYAQANADTRLPFCERLAQDVLSLPIHPYLDEDAVARIAAMVRVHAASK